MLSGNGGPCHILVAGADDGFLSQLQTVLANLGCKVYTAWTVAEAEAVLSRIAAIGVVVSQLDLPDGDWRTLLERCNERKPNPNLILLTESSADPEVWKELLMLGGFDTCYDVRGLERIAPEACRRWRRCQEMEEARARNLEKIRLSD